MGKLPPKKGKGKLPLFCGNVERVIPIYSLYTYVVKTVGMIFSPSHKVRTQSEAAYEQLMTGEG